MVTSVSTDRGRRQRLQCKPHIHESAPISVLPCQIPELGTLPSRLRLQSKEKTERETILSSFPADVWLARDRRERGGGGGSDLFGEAIFFLHHQMAGLRTLFNPIKDDEQFKHARGVEDEVLQGHHRWSPLSLLNC